MKYKSYARHNYKTIPQFENIPNEVFREIDAVSQVLPFKSNNYVIDELIDWDNYKEDPMFILNFPQKDMLSPDHYAQADKILDVTDKSIVAAKVTELRNALNPHPAGQLESNVPVLNGEKLSGVQHKYRETALFFPTQGQTCHAYCTFCFRWPQFTGVAELKFAMKETSLLVEYVKKHPEITDILITGGDPMFMNYNNLSNHINTILNADLPNLQTIRIGSKSLSFWPYKYTTDPDADDIIRLFEKVVKSGIQLSFMAHFNHPTELSTDVVKEAIKRILSTGAQIRSQSPVLNHINADSATWIKLWKEQVKLGIIPYYMFVPRDTGAQHYFAVTLEKAYKIFTNAYSRVSGISRTVRGPSMSADPGKVCVTGMTEIQGEKVFILNFIQARNKSLVNKPFFAKYNPDAVWLDDLEPAFSDMFSYEKKSEFPVFSS